MNCYKLKIALSLALKFGLVIIIFIALPASVFSFNCISCRCGSSSVNYTYCSVNGSKENFSCENLAQCQSCRDNSSYCITCPHKRFGPFCTEDAVPIPHGHRQKRVYYSASCVKRPPLFHGRMRILPPLTAPHLPADDAELPVGTRLIYSCSKGYVLQGKEIQTCEETRFWSGDHPTCIKEKQIAKCPDPGTPARSSRESVNGTDESEERIFLEGEALYFYCDEEDYEIIPERAQVINCTSFGNWTDPTPRCQIEGRDGCNGLTYCKNEGPLDHGQVQTSLNVNEHEKCQVDYKFLAGTVIEYSCDKGYNLQGASKQLCRSNGYWSKDKPSCLRDYGLLDNRRFTTLKEPQPVYNIPWVVNIFLSFHEYGCGGVLLDNTTVLTVAQCLEGVNQVTLIFGNLFSIKRSSRILIHPEYNDENFEYDIAIVNFSPPLRNSKLFEFISLPNPNSSAETIVEGKKGYAVRDWRSKRCGDDMTLSLLPGRIQKQQLCDRVYESNWLPHDPSSTSFCCGTNNPNNKTCEIWPGFPFVFKESITGRYILEGLASLNRNREEFDLSYTIFTQVSYFLEWILKNRKW